MIQPADIQLALQLIPKELGNTLYMVFGAGFFATAFLAIGLATTFLAVSSSKSSLDI